MPAGGDSNGVPGEIINRKEAAGPDKWAQPPLLQSRKPPAAGVVIKSRPHSV